MLAKDASPPAHEDALLPILRRKIRDGRGAVMGFDQKFLNALKKMDPAQVAERNVYIDRSREILGRGWDLPQRLLPLLLGGNRIRGLLHGCVGVGKTTEFARWAQELGSDVEVMQISIAEPKDWHRQLLNGFVQAISKNHSDNVDIKNICSTISWLTSAIDQEETQKYLQELDTQLQKLSLPILLLVDGFDLVDRPSELFGPGTPLCASYLPSIIYTAPHDYMSLTSSQARDSRFTDTFHLPPFPVVSPDLKVNHQVVAYLASGLAKRLEGLDIAHDPKLFEFAALKSGGILRHAVIILRSALLASYGNKLTMDHLLEGAQELTQDLEQGLKEGDEVILKEVQRTKILRGVPHLIISSAVLPYQSADRRYWVVHPLLQHLVDS